MGKVYFGIDLGTSSSSISYIADSPRTDRSAFVEPSTIRFNPPPDASFFQNWHRLPSMVYVEKKGGRNRIATGFRAAEAAAGRQARPFVNLFMSAKSDMGTLRIYEDSVHPDILTPVDVSAEVIKELVKAAEKEIGVSPVESPVVITVPASFTHSQRQDTLRAARLAGLTVDEGALLDEPVAAFIHTACHQKLDVRLDMKEPKNILMFDLGAGTCDVSVFEATYSGEGIDSGIGLQIVNLAISNYERLGGDNIDLYIVRKEILPAFCDRNSLDFESLPEKVKRELRFRLKLKAREIKEGICRQMAHDGGGKKIRQSWKIDIFPISALNMRTKKTDDATGLDSFLEIMQPFLTHDLKGSLKISDDYMTYSFFGPVFNALEKGGLTPGDIHGFIFNGGSCHSPVIRKALESYQPFSAAGFFDTPDLDLSVSKGAAIHCYHLHHHGRSLVRPIVNADIGIYTLGLKKEQIVAAGTPLPYPEEGEVVIADKFCVPKEGMSRVMIPVYAGRGAVVSSLSLPLPEGTRKGEPIDIGFRIDRNKMLFFSAFMRNAPDIRINAELSNPWTHRVSQPEDMEVNEIWQGVAHLKKQGQDVPAETLIHLANRERVRGETDAAFEILQRLEDKGHDTAGLHNIMGLCYTQRGIEDKALARFQKAAQMEPGNVTYATNYGSQLLECGSPDEAVSRLREAVNLNPDSYSPYYWLGFAYRRKGDEEAAKKEFTRAGQILRALCSREPNSEYHMGFLKEVELALGQYEEADMVSRQLQDIRNSKILGGNPNDLIAGPSSGLWREDELFEAEGRE